MTTLERRDRRRELTARLVVEYRGEQPPGRVLSAVLRADHSIPRTGVDDEGDSFSRCESLARIMLAGTCEPHAFTALTAAVS